MRRAKPYQLKYEEAVRSQLVDVGRKYRSLILRAVEAQLRHEPDRETLNREPLAQPASLGSAWELRCGPDNRFRVFYRIDAAKHEIRVLAVGVKMGNELRVGRERFRL